jgi:hypothetical protein
MHNTSDKQSDLVYLTQVCIFLFVGLMLIVGLFLAKDSFTSTSSLVIALLSLMIERYISKKHHLKQLGKRNHSKASNSFS